MNKKQQFFLYIREKIAVSFPLYSPEHKIEEMGKVRGYHMIMDKDDQILFEQ